MDNPKLSNKIIGILALQGDYDAHRKMLEGLGSATRMVRTPAQLEEVDGLILPGGESTTIAKLLRRIDLDTAIQARSKAGMPIYGTCAGMILLANEIEGNPNQPTLDLMDIEVARNAFGRQVDSFEADIPFTSPAGEPGEVRGVFIRAPYVTQAGSEVTTLAAFQDKIVGVCQGNLLATAFHPELTDDSRVHACFAQMVAESQEKR